MSKIRFWVMVGFLGLVMGSGGVFAQDTTASSESMTVVVDRPCSSDANCAANEYCYQPPMPVCKPGMACVEVMPARVCRPRKVVGEGQMCGGIAGIICGEGLKCDYGLTPERLPADTTTSKMIADGSGICVKVATGLNCGWCGTGCVDTRIKIACAMIAPPAGKSCLNMGGKCTIVTNPQMPCGSDRDCGVDSYCYQPPMPTCPAGKMCPQIMPSRVCRTCIPRPACLDANPACMIKMDPGSPPFCPPGKKLAQEGQMCGGIAGIMCDTGLTCRYQPVDGLPNRPTISMADRSGVCVRNTVLKCEWCGTGCRATSAVAGACPEIAPPGDKVCVPVNGACVIKPKSPTPTCIPKPACVDGIKDANGNVVYCDLKPGVVYCETSKAGDANGDGKTDLVDFTIWKKEYLARLIARADFNKDGKVDLVDFTVWKNNYLRILRTMTTDSKDDVQN